VTVRPRAPRNVHVGEGGDPVAVGFGKHEAGRLGSGLEPAEARKYVPGDAMRRIDWKATARLGEPHVREFEAETDRETVLFVDHRAAMGAGPPGETKLDYTRQVALAFVESAQDMTGPLGCFTVGDSGLTGTFDPGADSEHHRAIGRHVRALDPTDGPGETDRDRPAAAAHAPIEAASPARARRVADRLDDGSAFAARVRPFFDRPSGYVRRIDDEPLFSAISGVLSRLRGTVWSVVVTDDNHRAELREAVRVARRGRGRVLVFLTPTVLYAAGGLSDLAAAYEEYRDFERFRRDLASLEGVSAFEVGPGDRLAAVLAAGESERRTRAGWGGR
jgi:uncharacterized protein (DUF58 family)